MKYPTFTPPGSSRDMVDVFKGYNHNLRIGDGEYEEYDLRVLPCAIPKRQARQVCGSGEPPGPDRKGELVLCGWHRFCDQ